MRSTIIILVLQLLVGSLTAQEREKDSLQLQGEIGIFKKYRRDMDIGDYKMDSNFINTITKYRSRRGFPDVDYLIVVKINYDGITNDFVVWNKYFARFYVDYFQVDFKKYEEQIRDIITNNKTLYLLSYKVKATNKELPLPYLIGDEIGYRDSVFVELSKNKEAFLNYYFDENKIIRSELEDNFQNLDDTTIHIQNRLWLYAAIVNQLFQWGIPVNSCGTFECMGYGYLNEN